MQLATIEAVFTDEGAAIFEPRGATTRRRLLVLGADTPLGKEIAEELSLSPELEVRGEDAIRLEETLESTRDWGEYKVIINAATARSVDTAEGSEGRTDAWATNAQAVGRFARIARDHGIVFVQFSSDDVFDGTKAEPYTETDPLNPISVFGQSRAAGELAAMAAPKHYILRVGWVMNNGATFLSAMKRYAQDGTKPRVVNDLRGRLTFTHDIVRAVRHLLVTDAPYGVYNVSCSGEPLTWDQIAREVFAVLGESPSRVRGISSLELQRNGPWAVAPRPTNAVLDLAKIESTGFVPGDQITRIREYLHDEMGASDRAREVGITA